ncbi:MULTISPECIES: Ger(x)C family spore germination protein [Neobacillus]|uniref:Ger(X)C family spore germination protein n=1 Tax=Neobacillus rhizophilus TaxID=2833579 RepID=A0A942U7H1_9BACI|nr:MULTISPECIES: Ger(x)C family spore germination protein [Neobacillus]MBS4214342.1 Ger(x)C family spore germination protein [Neobacillus rhizophilus]MBU8915865.1 Ger(x)C family spore germination protein [Bacillus sp. FJAT-29953]
MLHNKRSLRLLLVFILILPLLSGCWDAMEMERRANVLAIGIDEAGEKDRNKDGEVAHLKNSFLKPQGNLIKVTAQIAIPGRIPLGPEQGGGQKPVLIMSVVGHSLEDALQNLQQQVANELFLGHLRIIVLNEKVARHGTKRLNDLLRRNPEIRRTAALVVSKEAASEYMKLEPSLDRVPSLYLADMVDNLSALGRFPPSFIGLFWTIYSSKGQEAYLPYLSIKQKNIIELKGLAYFKGDKMIGKTSPLEIGVFMAIKGVGKGGYGAFVQVPGSDKTVMVRIRSRKTKRKIELKNGLPHVRLKIRYECEIDEKESPKIKINHSKVLKSIEKETAKNMKNSIEKLISTTQAAGSDVFGFGEYFRAKLPRYWNGKIKTKENWERAYQQLTYEVKVDTLIHRVGMKAK